MHAFPSARIMKSLESSTQSPLVADQIRVVTRIGTACRAELETLCEAQGIAHQGHSGISLRHALKQQLLG